MLHLHMTETIFFVQGYGCFKLTIGKQGELFRLPFPGSFHTPVNQQPADPFPLPGSCNCHFSKFIFALPFFDQRSSTYYLLPGRCQKDNATAIYDCTTRIIQYLQIGRFRKVVFIQPFQVEALNSGANLSSYNTIEIIRPFLKVY